MLIWDVHWVKKYLFGLKVVVDAISRLVWLGDVAERITYYHLPMHTFIWHWMLCGSVIWFIRSREAWIWSLITCIPFGSDGMWGTVFEEELLDIMVSDLQHVLGSDIVCIEGKKIVLWSPIMLIKCHAWKRWLSRQAISPTGWSPFWCPCMWLRWYDMYWVLGNVNTSFYCDQDALI